MKHLKLLLAVMLLLCLLFMPPYVYYELVRFVSIVVFAIMDIFITNYEMM